MAESNFGFLGGEPITVGKDGVHSLLYSQGSAVADNGDSSFVFEQGTGIQTTPLSKNIIDDLERGNIDPYQGEKSAFSASTDRAYNGNWSMKTTATNNSTIRSDPGDGLAYYPTRGDQITLHDWKDDRTRRLEFYFGVSDLTGGSGTGANDGDGYAIIWYGTNIFGREEDFSLIRYDSGSETYLNTANIRIPTNEWITYTIDYDLNGDGAISATLSGSTGTVTVSAVDTTYDHAGVGWGTGATGGTQYFDYARKTN